MPFPCMHIMSLGYLHPAYTLLSFLFISPTPFSFCAHVCAHVCHLTPWILLWLLTGAWLGACLQAVHLIPVDIPLRKVSPFLISHYPLLNPQRWAEPRKPQLPSWQGALMSPALCGSCLTNHGCFQFRGAAATLCLEVSHSLVCSLLQLFLPLLSHVLRAAVIIPFMARHSAVISDHRKKEFL